MPVKEHMIVEDVQEIDALRYVVGDVHVAPVERYPTTCRPGVSKGWGSEEQLTGADGDGVPHVHYSR